MFPGYPLRDSAQDLHPCGLVRVSCPINFDNGGAERASALRKFEQWCSTQSVDPPRSQDFNFRAGWKCDYRQKRFEIKSPDVNSDSALDCICKASPSQLLLVSRTIHDEVSSVLYSENMFKICRKGWRGLSPLFALSPCVLASMTSLSIRLNTCFCKSNSLPNAINVRLNCPACRRSCELGGDDVDVQEWRMLFEQLATYIKRSQLRLSIFYDSFDYKSAVDVVEPLYELPTLADCAIRLGRP